MSNVHKSDQRPAEPQFLITARELQSYTIDRCTNQIPKRYTFYLGVPLSDLARSIYGNVKEGNSIYPKNQWEVQKRRDHFIDANTELQDLVSQIELAEEKIKFDEHYLCRWSELVDEEIRLIKGVMESDEKRYKDLPDSGYCKECPLLKWRAA